MDSLWSRDCGNSLVEACLFEHFHLRELMTEVDIKNGESELKNAIGCIIV